MIHPSRRLSAVLLCAAAWSAAPSDADAARRGFALITHGEDVDAVLPVSAEAGPILAMNGVPAGANVGYAYSEFGVFWLNLWTWDGQWCIVNAAEDEVWALENGKAEAAELAGVDESALSKPWTYTFPPGLILIGVLAVGWITAQVVGGGGDEPHDLSGSPPPERA